MSMFILNSIFISFTIPIKCRCVVFHYIIVALFQQGQNGPDFGMGKLTLLLTAWRAREIKVDNFVSEEKPGGL